MKETLFILYVKDQEASTRLYAEVLQRKPTLHVPGMTEFTLQENTKLGLMPEEGIARIISPPMPHPQQGSGIPRAEVYLIVSDVEAYYKRALQAGMKNISGLEIRNWGDTACYVADADGHIIAFAERG